MNLHGHNVHNLNYTMETSTNTTRVWCVLVMLNDTYACGAAVVARTLRDVHTQYPIWCMVSEGVSPDCVEFLRVHFDNIVSVPLISHAVAHMRSKKQNEIYGGWIHHSFTKWSILNPEYFPVDKVILLDADMIVLENIDDLFELKPPALTFSSPWAKPYMKINGAYNPYYINRQGRAPRDLNHGERVPRNMIERGLKDSILGLACMVLVRPSAVLYKNMLAILNRSELYGNSKCVSGMDEQLIAETLLSDSAPIHHIHQRFNWIVGKTTWLPANVSPKTQQYYHGKPWEVDPALAQWKDITQWWDVARTIMATHPEHIRWFYLVIPAPVAFAPVTSQI